MTCEATTGKGLKEKVDVAWQKEVALRVCVEHWIDEAFLIIVDIKEKLEWMKVMHDLRQGVSPYSETSAERVEQIQQTADQCAMDLKELKERLEGLHAKITTPVE